MDPMMQVSVTLISARGLKAADSNGKSDPYAKLHLHKHSHQSQTKYKTLDPEWGEEFFWKGKKGPMLSKPLHIQLFDHDMLSFDDPLGGHYIHLLPLIEQLAENEETDFDCDLDTQGSVRLKISWKWCVRPLERYCTISVPTRFWLLMTRGWQPRRAAWCYACHSPLALCTAFPGGRTPPRSNPAFLTCLSGIETSAGSWTLCSRVLSGQWQPSSLPARGSH